MQFALDEGVAVLSRTPAQLDALLRGLPEGWILGREGEGTWSPFDIVGHLIHSERTNWIPRARIILEQGEAGQFEPFDRLAQFRESEGKQLDELLDTFALLRESGLGTLKAWKLTEEDYSRQGSHPTFGLVTLKQLLATWVVHDLTHLHQLARVMARQYADEVGPWSGYLGVLHCQPSGG